MNRRVFLQSTAALTSLGAESRAGSGIRSADPLAFRLLEPAGIRRFGYPVTAGLPADVQVENPRLTRDGREVPAQFRRIQGPRGVSTVFYFNASPGPFEVEEYVITRRPKVRSPRLLPIRHRTATGRGMIEVANPRPHHLFPG